MADLSIIIVNYNTREPLRRCLQSIQAWRGDLNIEVIVVDNTSKDDSTAMVREVMPEAILIEPGRNTWFTGGNNIGLKKASGDYSLILNPDTVFQTGTLQNMLAYARANTHVGAVTCQMRFPDGRLQMTCSRVPGYVDLLLGYTLLGLLLVPLRNYRRRIMFFGEWDRLSNRAVEVAPDSNLMIKTSLMQQLKGFDEQMKLYFTEDDICRRILNAGYEVHFVADAILLHEEGASVSQVRRLASQVYFDDLLAFSRKYYGRMRTTLLQALMWPTRRAMDLAQYWRGERKSV
jgi:hypothetical protein